MHAPAIQAGTPASTPFVAGGVLAAGKAIAESAAGDLRNAIQTLQMRFGAASWRQLQVTPLPTSCCWAFDRAGGRGGGGGHACRPGCTPAACPSAHGCPPHGLVRCMPRFDRAASAATSQEAGARQEGCSSTCSRHSQRGGGRRRWGAAPGSGRPPACVPCPGQAAAQQTAAGASSRGGSRTSGTAAPQVRRLQLRRGGCLLPTTPPALPLLPPASALRGSQCAGVDLLPIL